MTLPVTIPNTFANATTSIPLANLDANFVTIYGAVNGIGNGAEALANVTISGGNATFTTANATTIDTTDIEVTNIKAKDGTASVSIADTTGIPTISKATVIETTDNTNAALRITQLGTGNALLVEESANPDSTPFVIDVNGRVIVGTTAQPYGSLTSLSVINNAGAGNFANNAFASGFRMFKSRSGTIGSQGVVNSGDALGELRFYGSDGTDFLQAATISASVDGTPGTNDMPGRLVFSTTADGASSPTERMRINSSGNVGIGTSSPGYVLEVYGATNASQGWNAGGTVTGFAQANTSNADFRIGTVTNHALGFYTNSTERARITSGGEVYIAGTTDQGAYNLQCNGTGVWGAGAYVNGSDERIKDDIAPIESGLDVVTKLNPVTYRYKEDWSKDQSVQTGFIAQELLVALEGQNYVDGIVQQGGSEGYYSVAYQNIIPILTKAIQEQQTIIESLQARIEALENNNV